MSITRLVVLGAVRVFQPVHGYFLRRELMTWRVDEWANINPGSVYNALRQLTKDGFLEELTEEHDPSESSDGRPPPTSYRLTNDGETEFVVLLRGALWEVNAFDPSPILACVSFMWALTRQEVIEAFEHRIVDIDAKVRAASYEIDRVLTSPATPDYVQEMFHITSGRLRAEQAWSRDLLERLRAGEYVFSDEPGYGDPGRFGAGRPPNQDAI
jgi:DNA-binding PadR family transcriptional regulator